MSMSMANMESLKRTVVKRVDVKINGEKKFRRFEEKDKPLLQYLGVTF